MQRTNKQERLFLGAPTALSVTAFYFVNEGWAVSIACRRDLQAWDDCHKEQYSHLSTAELGDVLELVLPQALGL